jgi:hypothetical protein
MGDAATRPGRATWARSAVGLISLTS